MIWTQATNESILRLTFPAPRFWSSLTSEVIRVGGAGIYMTDGSSSWSVQTAKPLHRGNLMSRTELKGSECNHGSGCGRSGSSASKLGTYRTLSPHFCKKYLRSTFSFLSLCAAGNAGKSQTLENCRSLPSPNTHISWMSGWLYG